MGFGRFEDQKCSGKSILFLLLVISLIVSMMCVTARADDALAGFGAEPKPEDPNSWEKSEPAPFSMKIRFDDKF